MPLGASRLGSTGARGGVAVANRVKHAWLRGPGLLGKITI